MSSLHAVVTPTINFYNSVLVSGFIIARKASNRSRSYQHPS